MPEMKVTIDVRAKLMRAALLEFLKSIEQAFPPPPNCHHAITYAQHGSDAIGWTDKLSLQINHDGRFFCFFIEDDDDMIGGLMKICREIGAAIQDPESMQQGVGFGQYAPTEG